jgi:hypothetical protein
MIEVDPNNGTPFAANTGNGLRPVLMLLEKTDVELFTTSEWFTTNVYWLNYPNDGKYTLPFFDHFKTVPYCRMVIGEHRLKTGGELCDMVAYRRRILQVDTRAGQFRILQDTWGPLWFDFQGVLLFGVKFPTVNVESNAWRPIKDSMWEPVITPITARMERELARAKALGYAK